MLYSVPRDVFEGMQDLQRLGDVWNENFGVMGQSDLMMDRLIGCQAGSSTEVMSLSLSRLESSSSTAIAHFKGVMITRMDDEVVDDIAVNTAAGGLSVWLFCRSGMARLYSIFAAKDHEITASYVGKDGLLQPGLGKEPQQDSVVDDAVREKSGMLSNKGRVASMACAVGVMVGREDRSAASEMAYGTVDEFSEASHQD